MTTSGDAIRETVAAIVQRASVSFSARYIGQTKRDEWDCDEWRVSFAYPGKPAEELPFFTGLGLRAAPTEWAKMQARHAFSGLTQNDIERRTAYGRRYLAEVERLRKPQAPHVADVLHSLILDSSAVGQSFRDWCVDYGYSDDSIKALAKYRACQESADTLRRIFKPETVAALSVALQDY